MAEAVPQTGPGRGESCCDVDMATEIHRVNVEMSEKTDIGKVN